MPNHWHFVLWPREDDELTDFVRWLTHTHTMRWHAHFHTSGTGHVYQGRFKAFPVETDEYFYSVVRYVERNALRAGSVAGAEGKEKGRHAIICYGGLQPFIAISRVSYASHAVVT